MAVVTLKNYSSLDAVGTAAAQFGASLFKESSPESCREAGGIITAGASIIAALVPGAGPILASGIALAGGAITASVCDGGMTDDQQGDFVSGLAGLWDEYSGADDYSV